MSSTESKTGTTKNPLPKKIVLSFFSRTQTVDLIEKSIITDGISKTAGNIRTEIEKNPSRIGRILSYDIIINFIGSRIREK